jgi:hypothetical protein
VLPGASCRIFAPSGTVTETCGPLSVAIVRLLPEIAFTVPRGGVAAAAAGACAAQLIAKLAGIAAQAITRSTLSDHLILNDIMSFPRLYSAFRISARQKKALYHRSVVLCS